MDFPGSIVFFQAAVEHEVEDVSGEATAVNWSPWGANQHCNWGELALQLGSKPTNTANGEPTNTATDARQ